MITQTAVPIVRESEIGATKRRKVRTVDFCDTLAEILRTAKLEQHKNRFKYGELFCLNYYIEVKEKDRTYYEVYTLPRNEKVPDGYKKERGIRSEDVIERSIARIPMYQALDTIKIDTNAKTVAVIANEIKQL